MSARRAKIIRLGDVSEGLSNPKKKKLLVTVLVSYDVLWVVLRFLTRRQLTKLERVERRFHQIAGSFGEAPLLRLENLQFVFGSTKLEASVCSGIGTKLEKISPIKFTAFPFLRFGHLTLDCTSYPNNRTNEKEFDKKCEQLRNHLQRLKPALIDSTMEVTARTYDVEYSSDPNCFDQDYLLYYLRNEILPICDTWRYEFSIESNSDWDTFKHIVGEILQIPQVARCSDVRFNFRESVLQWPASDTRLPVEAISNWLNRPQVDAQKINAQSKERMRSLSIFSENHESNVEKEMCEHLKEVFRKAELPVLPFTFKFGPFVPLFVPLTGVNEHEKVSNKTTDEELSVDRHVSEWTQSYNATIKRSGNQGSK